MPAIILSDNGATSGSAGLKTSGGNDGVLQLQTTTAGGTPTTAISISNTQVVTYTNQPTYTGGTANGVLYLNGSKAVTSGTALVFDGSNLMVGTATSAYKTTAYVSGQDGFCVQNSATGTGTGNGTLFGLDSSSNGVMWSFDAVNLVFGNTNTERARIDSSGNFMVGQNSATGKLSVTGTGSSTTGVLAINATDTSNTVVWGSQTFISGMTAGQNIVHFIGSSASLKNSGYIGYKWSSSGSNSNILTLGHFQSDNLVNIDGLGNVGIGTQAPNAKLHLVTSTTTNVETRYQSTYAGGNFVDVGTSYNGANHYVYGYGSIPLVFATNSVERMRVNAGAAVLCLSGGNTSATGTGIAFPSSFNASSDLNTLDDYEEGTWTPSILQGGLSVSSIGRATYTKIGNRVWLSSDFSVTGTGNSSQLQIGGLPFTVVTAGWAAGSCYFGKQNTDYWKTAALAASGTSYMIIQVVTTAGNGDSMPGSGIGAGYINVSTFYEVA